MKPLKKTNNNNNSNNNDNNNNVNNKTLQTVEETKRYRVVFDKRVVDPGTFQSYPYGYEKQVTTLDGDPGSPA